MKAPAAQLGRKSTRACEVCILAGGLSTRMGRDKARLRLGRRTLLGHVRAAANQLGLPVRVIHRDLVPRCGPLGGIYTALVTTPAEIVLFLSCDMPFVSLELLREILKPVESGKIAACARLDGRAGFPLALRSSARPIVGEFLAEKKFSLQELASVLKAKRIKPSPRRARELFNINTPSDLKQALQRLTLERSLSQS